MTSKAKNILARLVILAVSLALMEGLLQLFAAISPRANAVLSAGVSPIVPDPHLEWRPRPGYPEHDRNGFRNAKVPAQSWAVALGDSQTYGVGVVSAAAWPHQLEELIGQPIYSMAFGGYGPVHSLLLWPEAIRLKPPWIIEAFYAGNDLYDAFHLVHDRGEHPELKNPDPEVKGRLAAAEAHETLLQQIERLSPAPPTQPDLRPRWRRFLSEHCKLFGLLRAVKRVASPGGRSGPPSEVEEWNEATRRATTQGSTCQIFNTGSFKTVFRPEYRLTALNQEDPRIAEGLRISLEAIRQLSHLSSNAGSRFVVLLVPTKELSLAPYYTNATPIFQRLVENETMMWDRTKTTLQQHGIAFVDGLPLMRKELAEGRQPYPVTDDGHPNAIGHRALATGLSTFFKDAARSTPTSKPTP